MDGIELTPRQLENFWKKVRKTETCWLWEAGKSRDGYGKFRAGVGRNLRAHRVSFALAGGKIPEGMLLCHRCDVRNCVNPDHLFVGTDSDNQSDCICKGRKVATPGEKNAMAKLTAEMVSDMRNLYSTGRFTLAQIAGLYEVSFANVSMIVNRKSWKHITTR